MPPLWKPEEADATVYEKVQQHSEGMISFTYRPPSEQDLEALKDTETYRSIMQEQERSKVEPSE
jgi:hypothetical protein